MFSLFQKSENGEGRVNWKLWLIAGGAILGILLLLLSGQVDKQTEVPTETTRYAPQEDELIIYQNYMEARVRELCESVEGVGNVTAVVTLSSGFESVYATEFKNGDEQYVIVGSGSSAEALFLSRSMPQIAGIGVVCHGGSAVTVRQELTSLLCATFRIPSNRVYITQSG